VTPRELLILSLYACFSELEQDISAAVLHQARVIKMASLRNSGV
jgi:hypothetical protein